MFELSQQTVVVTGGGRGIGRGIALAMAAAGARVVIAGRSATTLDATVQELQDAGAEALAIPTDITVSESVHALVAKTQDTFGYIDCWVNNAGSALPGDVGPLLELAEDQWDRVVDLNLKSTFFACQAAARAMDRGGSIVNISSRSATFPNPRTGQYGAAKAALDNLTATMAVEWGHRGIRVNAIAPGMVLTETNQAEGGSLSTPGRRARQIDTVPLGRLGELADVGGLAVFLASDAATWITGQVIQVNGGSRLPVGYLSYLIEVSRKDGNAPGRPKHDQRRAEGTSHDI
ncbi:MAG: 3-oxoacyl-[acyl-carrier protein] reductase [Pseudonocardiales bacterium]|nr:3-oxoacyl-[acyl-carrier protein] reductase [Pseudonocardiales bacterium]